MWETLERARRRLRRDDAPPDPNAANPAATGPGRDEATDLTFALGRNELERLIGALADDSGDSGRPDTPARLQAALGRAIETVAGTGVPTVTRRPAGLYTPETWQIEIARADGRTRAAVDLAIRGGGTL